MVIISQRALVLHEIIQGIDHDIKKLREQGQDTSELESERKRRADECMYYLEPVEVPRKRSKQTSA